MTAVAEHVQMIGLEGVAAVQQWLESTTHVSMPFNVYKSQKQCTLRLGDGRKKRFDLAGFFLEDTRPLFVESKKYSTPGNQGTYYKEFLANVYSYVEASLQEDPDDFAEFMWITWHPFAQKSWTKLTTHSWMMNALHTHPDALNGRPIDHDVIQLIIPRLWLVVMSDRQRELALTRDELALVGTVIKRGQPLA